MSHPDPMNDPENTYPEDKMDDMEAEVIAHEINKAEENEYGRLK